MAEPQKDEPMTYEFGSYEPTTYERHGCKITWLKSPFKDLYISRVVGTIKDIASFGEVYRDLYSASDLKFGNLKRLNDTEWVTFWFRWIDDI